MSIKCVYQTEDGEIFESEQLAEHHNNVVALAKRLASCQYVVSSWPYDGMITAAKWLYDQHRIENDLKPIYRQLETEEIINERA